MANLLNIGQQGIRASQTSLTTVSKNITNMNSVGYSRQSTVHYSDANVGVSQSLTTRVVDQYAIHNLQQQAGIYQSSATRLQHASVLDKLVAETSNSISTGLGNFFASLNDAVNNPTDITSRRLVLTQASQLVDRFNRMNGLMQDQHQAINDQLTGYVSDINRLSSSIADLNKQINSAVSLNKDSLELQDKRDELVRELSEFVGVYTAPAGQGMVNVYLKGGQSLVMSDSSMKMGVTQGEYDKAQFDVTLEPSKASISSIIQDGKLGGTLAYRRDALNPTMNELGQLAAVFTDSFNRQQNQGRDLNNAVGADLFTPALSGSYTVSSRVLASANNTGSGAATLNFPASWSHGNLTASDYEVRYNAGSYSVTRLSDNQQVATGAGPNFSVDGFDLAFTGSPANGDSFLVRPTYNMAGEVGVTTLAPAGLAFAGSSATATQQNDNTNGLALIALQNTPTLAGGTLTYQSAYSQTIGRVGGYASQARIDEQSDKVLLTNAQNYRDSVSGVNLDEEAANLMRYREAYQAAAQIITTSQRVFESLLNAVR